VARVLQNGKANGSGRENGWKEVTEKAGQEGHNSRELAARRKRIIKQKIKRTTKKL
jgi:hypothetical protein